MTTSIALDNPYWDAVKDHINPTGSLWGTPEVGGMDAYGHDVDRWIRDAPKREELVKRYAWTITDPDTVAFVAEYSNGALVDPMAGTGYWGWVLAQAGTDVVSFDRDPRGNHWHAGCDLFTDVLRGDGAEVAAQYADRTLLLAWPPYDTSDGLDILTAFRGERVIYIGEGDGGCTGNDAMHSTLAHRWIEVAHRVPVQWFGMHDVVTVYDRKI